MTRTLVFAALMALPLAACQTMMPPVEVTRFHSSHVPTRGTVSVAAMEGVDTGPEFRTYALAVEQALAAAGFTVVNGPGDRAEHVAKVAVRTDLRPGGPRPRPVSGVVGGFTGSYGSGLGVGININLSGKPKDVESTELSVRLTTQMGTVLWEGRALMEAKRGTPAAQPGIAAGKLADALFRGYPGTSGATITVE